MQKTSRSGIYMEAMMLDILLFLHFVGLAIGAGTGVYLAALGRHAAQHLDESQTRTLMPGFSGAIARVGHIGLGVLLLSGLGLAVMIGRAGLSPLFWVKMLLVGAIVAFVMVMNRLAARVQRQGDTAAVLTMKKLSPFGPGLAGLTVLYAVLAFH